MKMNEFLTSRENAPNVAPKINSNLSAVLGK